MKELACALLRQHGKGRDIDPTGGDPWMGGPVLITICEWCGDQLETSDEANAYNEMVRQQWEQDAKDSDDDPWPPKRRRIWRLFK